MKQHFSSKISSFLTLPSFQFEPRLTVTYHLQIVLEPRVPSDGVVPGKAQFANKAGLSCQCSTVVYQGDYVRGPLETCKLEIFEANCGLASVSRRRLSLVFSELK